MAPSLLGPRYSINRVNRTPLWDFSNLFLIPPVSEDCLFSSHHLSLNGRGDAGPHGESLISCFIRTELLSVLIPNSCLELFQSSIRTNSFICQSFSLPSLTQPRGKLNFKHLMYYKRYLVVLCDNTPLSSHQGSEFLPLALRGPRVNQFHSRGWILHVGLFTIFIGLARGLLYTHTQIHFLTLGGVRPLLMWTTNQQPPSLNHCGPTYAGKQGRLRNQK